MEATSSEQFVSLRLELKKWENSFKKEHGRVPGKDDIKKSPEIAKKYKEYQKLKQPASKKSSAKPKISSQAPSKETRKQTSSHLPTHKLLHTPVKNLRASQNVQTPMSTRTLSILATKEVGPTPQIHGNVLGLFDLKSFSPLKSRSSPFSAVTDSDRKRKRGGLDADDCPPISGTPTTPKRHRSALHSSNTNTPMSSSFDENFFEDNLLVTPKYIHNSTLALPNLNIFETPQIKPSMAARQSSDLESNGINAFSENDLGFSPVGPRKVRRGLSSIIAEMRKSTAEVSQEVEESSQIEDAPDEEEVEHDFEDLDHLGENREGDDEVDTGNLVRPRYKKKGQKRTTKRHVFRPDAPVEGGTVDDSTTSTTTQRVVKKPANFKRLKLGNSGFKGRPTFFKRR